MNARVLLVTRFRDLSMKVAGSNRDAHSADLKFYWDGVLSTDNTGLVTFINPAAEQLIGWMNAEGVGRHLLEVVIHDLTGSRAMARILAHPAEHDVLNPLLSGECNRRKQGTARAPTQNKPSASDERQSPWYPGQRRPWRSRSAAPRALR